MTDQRATHIRLPWRYLDIGEIMDADDNVVMTDVPEDIGEFMVLAANGRMPVCGYCKGKGTEVDYVGPEMKPYASTCSHCNGEGVDPDALVTELQSHREKNNV